MRKSFHLALFSLFLLLRSWACGQVPSSYNCFVERAASVLAIRPQADGRVIIGGSFDFVNGVPRNNLARLHADGSLDTNWNPNADGTVYAIAVSDTNIYVGGQFRNIGGLPRPYFAKLSYFTGAAQGGLWAKGASNTVRALALSGNDIYVGGSFTNILGTNRNYIALVNIDGSVDGNFTNGADDDVRAVIYHLGDVFAGGDFSTIGGAVRPFVAKLHYFDGSALSWNPRPNNAVLVLADTGSHIILGGYFDRVTNQLLNLVAKVDDTTGSPDLGWNPGITGVGFVEALDCDLFNVYIGGNFTQVNGYARGGFVKVSNSTATVDLLWTNEPDNDVNVIYVSAATNVLLGGRFARLGTHRAISIARMTTNGVPNPGFPVSAADPGYVYAIVTQADGRVIIGGSFDSVMSQDFPNLVRFDADGSIDTNWAPLPSGGAVDYVFPFGTSIYAAGTFDYIGGKALYGAARLNDTNGQVVAGWTNRAWSVVYAAAIDSSNFYVGGLITNLGGVACRYLARTRHSDNRVDTNWLPYSQSTIFALATDTQYVYCGGAFASIGGQAISNLARISRTGTGTVDTAWNPHADGWVQRLVMSTSHVYVAGYFDTIGGENRNGLARVSRTTPATADAVWQPEPMGGYVYAVAAYSNWVYVGGSFTDIGGELRHYLARVNSTNGDADLLWNPEPDLDARAILPRGRDVAVGGLFGNIGGMSRAGLAWLEPFHMEGMYVSNTEPHLVWRAGSNRLFTVQYALSAFGPYLNAKVNVLSTPETNVWTDSDRLGPAGVYYRVFEQ